MSYISYKIKECFPENAIMKGKKNSTLFAGRNIPSFVRDYLIRRYSDEEGNVNEEELKAYLEVKMPDSYSAIKSKLLAGESVNITTRIKVLTDLAKGKTTFTVPDAQINSNAFISPTLIDDCKGLIYDGDIWANITMEYVQPQGRTNGYINMTTFKPFNPYRVDLDYFRTARQQFTTEEWIDLLIAVMEYNPDKFENIQSKFEMASRLLILVEPRLNMIELGPKGTGKSYVYNNFSKHAWMLSSGKTSRAQLFYNKATKQYGPMKYHDAVIIDEISTFGFSDPNEMQSIFKCYLEQGTATVDNVTFLSSCGIQLMGNLPLNNDFRPVSNNYWRILPKMFHESATIDRFHGFIEGWKIPRLQADSIINDWSLDAEYLSTILHQLRTENAYTEMFNVLVKHEDQCDLRDLKAVSRIATAYHKLLFPHITDLSQIEPEQINDFKALYRTYCLEPAIYRRSIIRQQCHQLDKEYKAEMPKFEIR